jgi:hypothetical protein
VFDGELLLEVLEVFGYVLLDAHSLETCIGVYPETVTDRSQSLQLEQINAFVQLKREPVELPV